MPPSQPAPPGVQDVYQLMMRDQITPALHELGFRGTRVFSYGRGPRAGYLRFQKDSRFVRRQVLHFTVNVGYGYGSDRIASLMPFPQTDTWWDVRGGQPTEQVAAAVVAAVRRYARPAILAGLEDPDPARDPAEPDGGGADSAAWFVQPARTIHDEHFARLTADTPEPGGAPAWPSPTEGWMIPVPCPRCSTAWSRIRFPASAS